MDRFRRPALRLLRLLWLNAAVLITLVAVIELASFTYFAVRSLAQTDQNDEFAAMARDTPEDAYPDRSWLAAYYRELEGPSLQIRWSPYVYWRRAPSQSAFINVDDEGIRRTWNDAPGESATTGDVIHVAMFGGSAMWGTGARDDFTIASQLSKLLAGKYPRRIHVTNYGEIGYVSTQSILTLVREIHAGRIPDIALFYEGYNDTFSAYQNGRAGLPQNEANRVREFDLLGRSRQLDFYRELLSRTNSYALIREIRDRLRRPPPAGPAGRQSEEGDERLTQDLIDVYSRNMELVAGLARTWNFDVRVYWQPTVFTKPRVTPYEAKFEPDTGRFGPFYRQTMTALDRSDIQTKHPAFRNLSGVFDGYAKTAFIDDVHTTEIANEMIATRMATDLEEIMAARIATAQRK